MTTSIPSSSARRVSTASTDWACDALMEAAWLAAAIVVPLILNPHAFDSFGPYKAATVRLVAAIIAAAWTIRACADRRFPGVNRLPPRPVGIALLVLVAGQLLATVFSVNPRASLWGGVQTFEGLFTCLAEAVLFLAVAVFLRRTAQVDRLVTALVATSIPVAIYALIQHAGFEPIAFADSEERVFSTLGQPIFLAAYLAMVMPLTWWKIIREAVPAWPASLDRSRILRLLFHAGVAVLQVAAFLCAKSRGPLLGLMAAVVIFFLGWAVSTRRRQWTLRIGAAIGLAVTFLVFLNLPLPASTGVAHALGLERFSESLALRNGADPFRKEHWNAGVDLMTSSRPIVFPDGGSDRWHALRPWIGYGPETLANVLPQRYLWQGAKLKPENRLHNRVLDLWFETGAIGVLAFLSLFLLVFQQGMERAGLGSRRIFFLLVPGLAMVVSALFCLIGGKGFLGLGMIVGLVAGCGLSILATARNVRERPEESENDQGRRLLIVALLAALVGDLLETGFAFTVSATSLLFWLYGGMLVAPVFGKDSGPEAVIAPVSKNARKGRSSNPAGPETRWWEGCLAAYGPTLILVTLVFAFVQVYSVDTIDWTTALVRTLTQIKGEQGPSHLIWFLFLPTWLGCNFIYAGDAGKNAPNRFWMMLTISAAIGGAFAIVQGAQIAAIGPLPRVSDPPQMALAQIAGYQGLYFTFIGLILALLLGVAWMLNRSTAVGVQPILRPVGLNVLAIGLGFVAAWFLALREIHAEITGTWGRALVSFGHLEAGTEVLGQAVLEVPDAISYRGELGAAFIRRAQAARNFETFDWLSREAEASLLPAAAQAHGLSTAGADLARLYLPWAAFTRDPGRRLFLARRAATYFDRQQCFAPGHPVSWLDSAALNEFLQQPEEAARQLQIALGLMADRRIGYWADAYRELSLGCSSPELRQAYATVVLRLYGAAIQKGHSPGEIAVLRMGRVRLNTGMGRPEEARQECLEVQSALPAGELWQAEAALAEIDRQTHRPTEARIHVDKALALAPEDKRAMLLDVKRRLELR